MPGLLEPIRNGGGEELQKKSKIVSIGSFRSSFNLRTILPDDIYSSLFDPVPDNLDIKKLITVPDNKRRHFLNNAAFGRAYDDVRNLGDRLRQFAESNPDTFYDQACLPLINHTYEVLEDFFKTDKIVMTPNCTFGMRAVLERIIADGHKVVAQLSPIYGATQKLLGK